MQHYVTLRYFRLFSLHVGLCHTYIALRYITLHVATLQCVTLHFVTSHLVTLRKAELTSEFSSVDGNECIEETPEWVATRRGVHLQVTFQPYDQHPVTVITVTLRT